MKPKFFQYIGFTIFLISLFYLVSRIHVSYSGQHTTLNNDNMETDDYLKNARHFAHENVYDRSAYHVKMAIKSLKNLEEDIDLNTGEYAEAAIAELETIRIELEQDSLVSEDMNAAFAKTLNTISLAELRISEKYAESNKLDLAQIALKYARLHLKNALEYSNLPNRALELHVYSEMDSLINTPGITPIEITLKLDHMIMELDNLLANK